MIMPPAINGTALYIPAYHLIIVVILSRDHKEGEIGGHQIHRSALRIVSKLLGQRPFVISP